MPLRLVPVPLAIAALSVGLVPAAAPAGKRLQIAFESDRTAGVYQIYVMNADGTSQRPLTRDHENFDPAWSPGGGQLVFESDNRTGKYSDLWVMNASGSKRRQLTNMGGPSRNPAWSPDGKTIAFQFSTNPAGPYAIYLANVKTAWPLTRAKGVTRKSQGSDPAWSSDGRKIAFDNNGQIYVMNADGTARQQLTTTPLNVNTAWSRDDKMIAFVSNRTGSYQIWKMSLKGDTRTQLKGGIPTQLTGKSPSDGQNFDPSWSPDGKTIVFASNRDGNLQLYSMSLSGGRQTRLTTNSAVDLTPNFWQNPAPSPKR